MFMKLVLAFAWVSLFWLGGAAIASAEPTGEVSFAEGGVGSLVVTRDGAIYNLIGGDPIFEGDIVSTRAQGAATLSAYGCAVSLAPGEQVIVRPSMCDAGAIVNARQPATGDGGLGMGSETWFGILFAGTVVAIESEAIGASDADTPVSP